jgi:hypothetical protein
VLAENLANLLGKTLVARDGSFSRPFCSFGAAQPMPVSFWASHFKSCAESGAKSRQERDGASDH